MATLTRSTKKATKRSILANQNIELFGKLDGMELGDVYDKLDGGVIGFGYDTQNDITNLILETNNSFISMALSRQLSEEVKVGKWNTMAELESCVIRKTNKAVKDDAGDVFYTGDAYISIGKPNGLDFSNYTSLTKAVSAPAVKA